MNAVLVTVAQVDGSGPRECGARMLVAASRVEDTIGGGHLELRAIEIARALLHDGRMRHFERFALGPSLGQCCGGVVYLAFEHTGAAIPQDQWRIVPLDGEPGNPAPPYSRARGTHVILTPDGQHWLVDAPRPPRAQLLLFGAGHVGTALVRALSPLPCTITWADERDDMFPAQLPANVRAHATDTPEALVAAAPRGASYLVMTHSHALDQRLTEAIMARSDVGWFGLIGSLTKRRQFEHRLQARGVEQARIDAMVCPIGLAGIANKAPAVIAASVAAQLLMIWEAAAPTDQIEST